MRKILTGDDTSERIDGTGRDDEIRGLGGNDELIGHPGDDKIWGGDGNDKIWGGQDHDTLWGDAGNDQFRFNSLAPKDSDTVKDFQEGEDRVGLDIRVFTELEGGLTENNFVLGKKAGDDDDFVIYDPGRDRLYYDDNGDGKGGKVLLAEFKGNPDFEFEALFIYGIV